MDIEKVIESLRYSVETTDRCVQAVRNADTDNPFPVIPLPLPEARALLTEIDYWRARCGKAEKFIDETPCDPDIHEDQIAALDKSQDARKRGIRQGPVFKNTCPHFHLPRWGSRKRHKALHRVVRRRYVYPRRIIRALGRVFLLSGVGRGNFERKKVCLNISVNGETSGAHSPPPVGGVN